jgi:hypothetical protein
MIFTPDDVHERFRTDEPFKPVQLVTTTGQTYDIHHPEMVMFFRHYLFIGLPNKNKPFVVDRATRLAYVHLAEMRDLDVPTPPSVNGQAGSIP